MTARTKHQAAAKNNPPEDDPEQSKRFLAAAKAHGADETEKGAGRAFKAVVKPRRKAERTAAEEYADDQRAIAAKLRRKLD
jgi:hypothetical protein